MVTRDLQLLLITVHRYYMRVLRMKRKLKIAGVAASWLLHCDSYVRLYYSEHYNRDVQVNNLEN